ncbi:immediate early response gene 5-like protein [Antennarius striatus]|uniref:immediate early response gene 5-like protein n=1 Tax=Antennarius striatus TaxID=241820 RepID=UPI0035B3F95C
MECALDAQNLISLSLMKIHNSRTQRGGIKLHKNLLVSYVLRNARQVYIKEKYAEIYRMQQYEEALTVCGHIQPLPPRDPEAGDEAQETRAASLSCSARLLRDAAPTSALCRTDTSLEDVPKAPGPCYYRSCCMETPPAAHWDQSPANSNAHCNKTTVLDLDTHVVTTVENGLLHQDCCCDPPQGQPPQVHPPPAKKRKVEPGCGSSDPEELSDFTASRKRAKREDCAPLPDHPDSSNISALISIFGSGFSGLLSRQADLDQICSKQVLASLGAWSRAIVAF